MTEIFQLSLSVWAKNESRYYKNELPVAIATCLVESREYSLMKSHVNQSIQNWILYLALIVLAKALIKSGSLPSDCRMCENSF